MRLLFILEVVKCRNADTSSFSPFRRRKTSDYTYSNKRYIAEWWWFSNNSQTSEIIWGLVQAALPTETDVFFCVNSCVFFSSVSDGRWAAESVFAVFHVKRMENDVNLQSLPNPICLCFTFNYISDYFSVIESFCGWLLLNEIQSENIGTDCFRCGVDSVQLRPV